MFCARPKPFNKTILLFKSYARIPGTPADTLAPQHFTAGVLRFKVQWPGKQEHKVHEVETETAEESYTSDKGNFIRTDTYSFSFLCGVSFLGGAPTSTSGFVYLSVCQQLLSPTFVRAL